MQTRILGKQDILTGYDAVCPLYPHLPSVSHWRAWEYAGYQHYHLRGDILDLGCGDGQYFRLLWPQTGDVVGVDINPVAVSLAQDSGVYKTVHLTEAHQVPEPDGRFDHVFANCSLEHMDELDAVLAEVYRCLKPGGTLLCSVVTHRFIEWAWLGQLMAQAGFHEAAQALNQDFLDFHNLANPLTPAEWEQRFLKANLVTEDHIPILPQHNSSVFLFIDSLWHLRQVGGGEVGHQVLPALATNPNFPGGFRSVLAGLLDMEIDWLDCSGAIFHARKPMA